MINTEDIMDWIAFYAPEVAIAIVILIVGRILSGITKNILKRILVKNKIDETFSNFVASVVYAIMITLVFITALSHLGVPTASFIAIVAASGLAVALAFQGTLSNFAAGVLLLILRPFKIGDFVEAGGASGVIENIAVFSTHMKTGDNKVVIIPNGNIIGGNIVNYSIKEQRRVDILIGVGYNENLDKVRKVLESILSKEERILKDPEPVIAVAELAASSVNFTVRSWVQSSDYWGVYFALQEKIKKTFDVEGISIPFPQQDVHMHQKTPDKI